MKLTYVIRVTLAGVGALLLQSCFVAKEYQRPDLKVIQEESYRTDLLPQDSISMADISWRELFTDTYLVSYIEEALTNNIDVRIALKNIDIAAVYQRQFNTGYWPSFGLRAGATHNQYFGDNPSDITQYEILGNMSWEADIWGKIRSQRRAGEADYLHTVFAHHTVKTELIGQVATLYYQLLALDEQLDIVNQTIANRENSIVTTEALKDAGQLTEVSVQQTKAQLKNVESLRLDILQQINATENLFSVLIGKNPQTIERSSLKEQKTDFVLNTGYPVQLLNNRPDVKAAEYALISAFEGTNIARSQLYPSVTLTVNGGLQNTELSELLDLNSLFVQLIGGITQPIFNNRKIKTQYEVSQALQEQAMLRFEGALLQAGREVSDALFAIQTSEEKIHLKTQENEAYTLALQYSEELINQGFGNYLEVLSARENALNSQISIVLSKYEKLKSVVALYRALGGGWK